MARIPTYGSDPARRKALDDVVHNLSFLDPNQLEDQAEKVNDTPDEAVCLGITRADGGAEDQKEPGLKL